MNNIVKIIILETVVLIFLLLLLFLPVNEKLKTAKVCFQNNCFQVEVAKTFFQQQKGLMFRDHLEKDKGMLFVFKKEGIYPFWMKNTYIPLDIIWMNKDGEVVFIKGNALPCGETCESIDPEQNAMYVLEINGGVSRDINLRLGEKIVIHY